MSLITLFSAPKPFKDAHIALIQRNALKSWTKLPDVDVILLGDEAGLADAAKESGIRHIRDVTCNENGTPLISSMFELARAHSVSPLLCIINADMILMPDFVEAAKRVLTLESGSSRPGNRQKAARPQDFVLLSQRWDLDLTQRLDFSGDWVTKLHSTVREEGQLHRAAGSDFFLFPRSCYTSVPDFAVGRAGWDNWMIYEARKQRWPVIDGTPSLMIVHQNHDYGHLPDAMPHYDSPETVENIRLAGGQAAVRYTILDSTHRLVKGKLTRPAISYLRFMRGVELFLRAVFFFLPEDMIEEVARPKRWKKRLKKIFR